MVMFINSLSREPDAPMYDYFQILQLIFSFLTLLFVVLQWFDIRNLRGRQNERRSLLNGDDNNISL